MNQSASMQTMCRAHSPGAPTRGGLPNRQRSGMAMILALALLTVMASVAVALIAETATSLQQADNFVDAASAQRQAESGLAFHCYVLRNLALPAGVQGGDLVEAVAAGLRAQLDGTDTLGGGIILHDANSPWDANTIIIPSIATSDRTNFSAVLSLSDTSPTALNLTVTGRDGTISRTLGIGFEVVSAGSTFFGDYGVASRGKVSMTGNARIRGANDPSEANVLSATYSHDEAVDLTGNCEIEGDLAISNPDGYASLSGNVSIGGEDMGSDAIFDHIHTGIGEVDFPEVDPAVFEPFATHIVDGSTSTSGNKTFENIRILAGTNKTFSGNITLKGVIYIETPNQVHFSGNVTITGVIVTQDAGDDAHETNTIKFTGNTTARSVEELPDEPQFAQLREMPGAFLLAPGFGAEFTGNFGTLSGCMAADRFKFTGNAGGTIKGGLINYGDTELKLTGNSNLTIDRSDAPEVPPGFALSSRATLSVRPATYREY